MRTEGRGGRWVLEYCNVFVQSCLPIVVVGHSISMNRSPLYNVQKIYSNFVTKFIYRVLFYRAYIQSFKKCFTSCQSDHCTV